MKAFQILHNQSKHAAQKQPFTMMSVSEDLSSVTFFSTCHFQPGHYKSSVSFLGHMIQWADVAFCLKDSLRLISCYESTLSSKQRYSILNILTWLLQLWKNYQHHTLLYIQLFHLQHEISFQIEYLKKYWFLWHDTCHSSKNFRFPRDFCSGPVLTVHLTESHSPAGALTQLQQSCPLSTAPPNLSSKVTGSIRFLPQNQTQVKDLHICSDWERSSWESFYAFVSQSLVHKSYKCEHTLCITSQAKFIPWSCTFRLREGHVTRHLIICRLHPYLEQ